MVIKSSSEIYCCHGRVALSRPPSSTPTRFRGGLVFKAHRRVYHSTLGLRVIMKKKKTRHTLNPKPETLKRQPSTLNPQHNPQPETLNPKPSTLNPKP